MKSIYTILFFLALVNTIHSQNLVPNPSFEEFTLCPDGENINNSNGWSTYGSSPEYFNSCAINKWNVPNNYIGYQKASTGNAYVGIIAYDKSVPHTDKEYFGRQLSQNLTIGKKYYVSFKVNLPKKDPSKINKNDCVVFACNKLGVLFTNTMYGEFNPPSENNFAHIYTDSIITDTSGWVTISGSFVADSAYNNIALGVFFDNNNVDTVRLFKPDCDLFAYYFFDDICVSTDSLMCNKLTGIEDVFYKSNPFSIYPNPVNDHFLIENEFFNQAYNLSIYSLSGQKLQSEYVVNEKSKAINMKEFERGLYIVNISSSSENYYYKISKQ